MADRVGQQLGNYRLIRLLGKGGFAEVYLGEHVYLETQAAIKVLLTQLASEDMEPFRLEAKRVAHLEHPHIVRVLEFGLDGTTPYLAMSYAPNGTLRERHPKGMALPLLTILSYVKQAADALQYAHDEHFIHRDVKPENLLVGRRQEVLLSDFGIALLTQTSRSQSMQDVAGTASYMAPEQFQGKPRPASDQYSLGIVVYEWLSGDRPFHGSFTEIASQHLFVSPPPLHERMSIISPAVEQVVMTALAKDPHQRFGNVQDFATALEQANQVEASQTLPASWPQLPTDAMPQSRSSQPPTELATAPGESVVPTELITPQGQSAIPAELSAPSSQMTILPEGFTPPSQISSPASVFAVSSNQGPFPTRLPLVSDPSAVPHEGMIPPRPSFVLERSIEKLHPKQRGFISRRTVILGLSLAGLAATGVGIAWWALSPHALYTYRGHAQAVQAVAWSPDSRRIASGGDDHTVQIWDSTTGDHVFTYKGHRSTVDAVAWSPDGKRIASGSGDTTVQVWDAADGGNVYTYHGHSDYVYAVAWSPGGKRIASGSQDATVQVWDAADGGNVYTYRGHTHFVETVAWSPDGKRIASGGSDTTVHVWDATDGGNVFIYTRHADAVKKVAWSPDGKRIASTSSDGTVQVWDVADGNNVSTSRHIFAAAWSPDGRRIASSSSNGTLQVWDAADGGNIHTYPGSFTAVEAVTWSPDGKYIAMTCYYYGWTVQVWQAQ